LVLFLNNLKKCQLAFLLQKQRWNKLWRKHMAIKISTINNLEIAILEPHGSIIGGNETDELKVQSRELFDQGNRKLVIDLGNVTYLNSSGIGALMSIHTLYGDGGGKIKLCNLGKSVKNVMVITRLTSVFDVFDGRKEAIASLK
jgi:anti-sigma B factor antagonist